MKGGSILFICMILAFTRASDVIVLTDSNFDESIKKGDWLLEFYAPWCGHCKELAPTYEKVAIELRSKVNVAKIDCTTESELSRRFEIKGFPTIKFFKSSENKIYEYNGDRSFDSLVSFATNDYSNSESKPLPPSEAQENILQQLRSDVVILTNENFDELTSNGDWLLEFYAPWCGHCRNLAPTYEKVAAQLKGKVNVGKVDATIEMRLGQRFKIRAFPTIKFLKGENIYDYKGDRSLKDFIKFTSETYKNAESSPLPKSLSDYEAFMEDLSLSMQQLEAFLSSHLWITLMSVFLLGLLIGTFVLSSLYLPVIIPPEESKKRD